MISDVFGCCLIMSSLVVQSNCCIFAIHNTSTSFLTNVSMRGCLRESLFPGTGKSYSSIFVSEELWTTVSVHHFLESSSLNRNEFVVAQECCSKSHPLKKRTEQVSFPKAWLRASYQLIWLAKGSCIAANKVAYLVSKNASGEQA